MPSDLVQSSVAETAAPENVTPKTILLPIQGMSCAACQTHVQRALAEAPGVLDATVNLMTHSARVVYAPGQTAPASFVQVVADAGYEAALPGEDGSASRTQKTGGESGSHEQKLRLNALLTIAGGVLAMILSLPLMHASYTGMAANGTVTGTWMDTLGMRFFPALYLLPPFLLKLVLMTMAALAIVWTGAPVYKRAAKALLHRTTNMNTLVALGTSVAFLYSVAATFRPAAFLRHGLVPDVYYDAVLFILGFLLLGNWLDLRAKRRTLDAVRAFAQLQPATARLLRNAGDSELEVPVGSVLPDDIIIVRPGERLPVDGQVLRGVSSVDESLITGESVPVAKIPGSALIGGSLNYDGALEYRATSVGDRSVLGGMLRLMEQAQSSKAPMQQLADRVSRVFVPAVLALAALTFICWALLDHTGGLSRAFAVSIAVLVIACPCAMGLAIPAALTVAVGRGAQLGVLFKGGEAVERLAGIDTVVFDKTGTLTEGTPRVVDVLSDHPDRLLQLAAALESRSEHPFARAILRAAEERKLPALPVTGLRVHPGMGLSGSVDGQQILIGNERLLKENNIAVKAASPPTASPLLPPTAPSLSDAGTTLLHLSADGLFAGSIVCRDALRPEAPAAIAGLHHLGLGTAMLTGDTEHAALAIAHQAGIADVHAGLLPAGKLDTIRALQASGRKVLMVGDGINDAAALAQADAGLAMGTGTDLAREAGDAVLLRGELGSVVTAIHLARQSKRIMRQNLGWALAYNVIGIPVAAGLLYPVFGILLSPSLASAAMALSSVSVLANSLRLKNFRPAKASAA